MAIAETADDAAEEEGEAQKAPPALHGDLATFEERLQDRLTSLESAIFDVGDKLKEVLGELRSGSGRPDSQRFELRRASTRRSFGSFDDEEEDEQCNVEDSMTLGEPMTKRHSETMMSKRHSGTFISDVPEEDAARFRPRGRGSNSSGSGSDSEDVALARRHNRKTIADLRKFAASGEIGDEQSQSSGENEEGSKFMLHPDGWVRVSLDLLTLAALVYDAFSVPFVLAWQPAESRVLLMMGLAIAFVWSIDMVLNFNTGIFIEGRLEMRRRIISSMYLRSWFAFDFVVNATDWFLVLRDLVSFSPGNFGAQQLMLFRLLKAQRFARLAALFRSEKLQAKLRFFSYLDTFVSTSSNLHLLMHVGKLSFLILWLNHLLCCAWYATGTLTQTDTGTGWLDEAYPMELSYSQHGTLFQYTTALHWAMTQMTPGSMEVTARNSWERLLSVMSIMFGLLFGSAIISMLSSKMVQRLIQKREQTRQITMLRQFLAQEGIHASLVYRVEKAYRHREAAPKRLKYNDVAALSLVPTYLQSELKSCMFEELIIKHPMLRMCNIAFAGTIDNFCAAAYLVYVSDGEELLVTRAPCNKAYIVSKGEFAYLRQEFADTVKEGTWICEPSLWVSWTTVGSLEATCPCEAISLEPSALERIVVRSRQNRVLVRRYSTAFARLLDRLPEERLTDVGFLDCGEAIAAMPKQCRLRFSSAAFFNYTRGTLELPRGWKVRAMPNAEDDLNDEFSAGDCMFWFDEEGHPIRIVNVVAVRLVRQEDGYMLAQVARMKNGRLEPCCQLPACRVLAAETNDQAAERLLLTKLSPFTSERDATVPNRDIMTQTSQSHGLQTRYFRDMYTYMVEETERPAHDPARRVLQVDEDRNSSTSGWRSSTKSNVTRAALLRRSTSSLGFAPDNRGMRTRAALFFEAARNNCLVCRKRRQQEQQQFPQQHFQQQQQQQHHQHTDNGADLRAEDVFYVPSEHSGDGHFYSWLSQDVYHWLRRSDADFDLAEWVATFDISQCEPLPPWDPNFAENLHI